MDIYQHLKADHDRQRALVARALQATDRPEEALRLFEVFCQELEAHEAAEEQTLYAEVLAHSRDVRLVSQGIEVHDAIVQLASALAKTDPHHEGWFGMLGHFNELLAFHLDNEENRIFGQLRRAVSQERAEALGERFETLKADEVAVWSNDLSTLLSLDLAESAATG